MTISGVGPRSSLVVQALGDMRTQLADLQRQLGTGKRSTTYAGLGIERGLAVGLRSKLSAMSGYADAATQVGVRISLQQMALTRIANLGSTVKSATLTQTQLNIDTGGQTATQRAAVSQLDEILGLLNTPAGDRYLFSGRAGDKPATETSDHILNGDGARAGLKQIIAERNQADLGANGLGRLVIPPAAGALVSISEETPPTVFGMKLASVSALNGATVTGPTGSPSGITVNFTALPNPGDAIAFSFAMPDGTSKQLTLTATNASPPAAGEFTIGADVNATATNLQASLTSAVRKLAATSLSAASAMAAADNFFNVDAGQPPMRVGGPPFNTATTLVAGTAANTVTWYTGEMGADSARGTAVAKVDDALSVAYGVRANEQAHPFNDRQHRGVRIDDVLDERSECAEPLQRGQSARRQRACGAQWPAEDTGHRGRARVRADHDEGRDAASAATPGDCWRICWRASSRRRRKKWRRRFSHCKRGCRHRCRRHRCSIR